MSSTALRARARAEVAAAIKKAELQKKRLLVESPSAFVIQQAELALARHKLDEQARLEPLRLEEAAAVAVAKANAIDDELGFGTGGELPHLDLPEENSSQKVQHFIENQCIDPTPNTQVAPSNIPNQPIPSTEHVNQTPNTQVVPSSTPNQPIPSTEHAPAPQLLNPTASTFTPNSSSNSIFLKNQHDQNLMKSCIEFVARRELIANKIEKFDNSPENFHTWKLSFKNMTRNINITPSEELSLIIEYTTNESKKLVQKLRNAYIENPEKGVAEVWTKLGERYGSNVVLTKAYVDKLTNFPKIEFKDNKKLQEFGDLLLELQCAKEDGRLQ